MRPVNLIPQEERRGEHAAMRSGAARLHRHGTAGGCARWRQRSRPHQQPDRRAKGRGRPTSPGRRGGKGTCRTAQRLHPVPRSARPTAGDCGQPRRQPLRLGAGDARTLAGPARRRLAHRPQRDRGARRFGRSRIFLRRFVFGRRLARRCRRSRPGDGWLRGRPGSRRRLRHRTQGHRRRHPGRRPELDARGRERWRWRSIRWWRIRLPHARVHRSVRDRRRLRRGPRLAGDGDRRSGPPHRSKNPPNRPRPPRKKAEMASVNRVVIAMLVAAALAFGFWVLALGPKREEAGKLATTIASLKESLALNRQQVEEALLAQGVPGRLRPAGRPRRRRARRRRHCIPFHSDQPNFQRGRRPLPGDYAERLRIRSRLRLRRPNRKPQPPPRRMPRPNRSRHRPRRQRRRCRSGRRSVPRGLP